MLAAQRPLCTISGNATTNYALYDCASGKQIVLLIPTTDVPERYDQNATSFETLRWSPDGAHLLLLDGVLGVVSIWDTPRGKLLLTVTSAGTAAP
jgi:WD40 repeat protein